MVTIEVFHAEASAREQRWRLCLTPNRPLDDSATFFWLLLLAIAPLFFALVLAVAGFWPVLPFAGLEIAVLAYGLFQTANRNDQMQFVEVGDEQIVIAKFNSTRRWYERLQSAASNFWQPAPSQASAAATLVETVSRREPTSKVTLRRAWTQTELLRSRYRWHPSRLMIVSHGKHTEIGGFLTEGERRELHLRLQSILASPDSTVSTSDLVSIVPKAGQILSN